MSTSPTLIAGTTQIWNNFKAVNENKEDKEEEADRTSLYVEVFKSITELVFPSVALLIIMFQKLFMTLL